MSRRRLHAFLMFLCTLLIMPSAWAQLKASSEAKQTAREATISIYNRDITVLRGELLGIAPEIRARRAEERIREQLLNNSKPLVSVETNSLGAIIKLDGMMMFALIPADVDVLSGQSLPQAVAATQKQLEVMIAESAEGRNADRMLRNIGYTVLATAILFGLLWLANRARRLIGRKLATMTEKKNLKIDGVELVPRIRLLEWLLKLNRLVFYVFAALLMYEWLSTCLAFFPYTRPWAEGLNGFLFDMFRTIFMAIVHSLPNILIAAVIFLLASALVRLMASVFGQIRNGQIQIAGLDPELAEPTRKILSVVIWLFALVMAYPYLPGSGSAAFQGVSVLVGLMLSLGASSIVSQGASGLILTYSRTFKPGEYVRIGDIEGTVIELGMFNTRLRTGMGEEITLANSSVFNATTRNYSRAAKGDGYMLDTTVTIGYDTPWRQVEAMLLEAAKRTRHIAEEPKPRVFQTALSDYYPEYRLVCQAMPDKSKQRAVTLSDLHANIQDVFNQYGVQIMSPHYVLDPQSEKIVPEHRKYAEPAKPAD